ncbi:hypothetical protein BHE74_00001428 [Ensete ventricosum]|nr:hypothetical protein GW17_00034749 [Ensete ventricosum]RWW89587.1 hypothetical protein BHE74_00001428 [Ensete ventricosum]RZR78027.1 hypothetical protein BHM03_00003248 [Ensete ventricosum]
MFLPAFPEMDPNLEHPMPSLITHQCFLLHSVTLIPFSSSHPFPSVLARRKIGISPEGEVLEGRGCCGGPRATCAPGGGLAILGPSSRTG